DLASFNYCRYFTLAKIRMQHSLAAAIRACAIIRRTDLRCRRSRAGRFVMNARAALGAADPGDLSFGCNRGDDVTALFTAGYAHLVNSLTDFENLFCFHDCIPVPD